MNRRALAAWAAAIGLVAGGSAIAWEDHRLSQQFSCIVGADGSPALKDNATGEIIHPAHPLTVDRVKGDCAMMEHGEIFVYDLAPQ